MDNTGLDIADINRIKEVFKHFPEVEKVLLYGSRAMGRYKPASDIDLCLVGEKIDLSLLQQIEFELDDLMLPYKFDVSVHHKITNPDFKNHIDRVGREFYVGSSFN
jgi:predicted nucleotidyltransferase